MNEPTDGEHVEETAPARWDVRLAPSAIRNLDGLSPRVVPAIIEFLFGPLADNPYRLGKPLRGDFDGSYGARRGTYRVLFDIDEAQHVVRVYRISARATAYRPASG